MKFKWFYIALMVVITSCQDSSKTTTESGVEIKYINKGESVDLVENDILLLNMEYANEDSSVYFSFKKQGRAFPARFNEQIWKVGGGYYEVLKTLGIGDSVNFSLGTEEFYTYTLRRQVPDNIDPESKVKFTIGVVDIVSWEKYLAIMREEVRSRELEVISKYLSDNQLESKQTDSGLNLVVKEQGNGPSPEVGDKISVNYRGAFMNDTVFDSSEGRAPLEFTLGQGEVISGWDEGFGLINVGTKATLLIPSALAYGEQGYPNVIPPNTILKFDVELLEIIK